MTSLFSRPKVQPAQVSAPPSRSAAEVQEAAERQRRTFASVQGGGMLNMLTGGRGVTNTRSMAVQLLGQTGA